MFRTPTCLLFIMLSVPGLAKDVAERPPGPSSIIVNVSDEHGTTIRDLTKDNFRVRLNGKTVAVRDARFTTEPRRIVILLDISGSMTEPSEAKWNLALEAVKDVLTQTPKEEPIAMLTFAGGVRDVFDFSQGRYAIAEWMNGPTQRPVGKVRKTALFDAIMECLKLFGPAQVGDVVYAITDGGDNASRNSYEVTEAALLQSQVRLFSFFFAEPLGPNPYREKQDSFLSLVADTGGRSAGDSHGNPFGPLPILNYVYNDDSREKLKEWTRLLSLQVNEFWTLDLDAAWSGKKKDLKLDIVNANGKGKRGVRVVCARFLMPSR